jgi:hypothetical protein
VRVPPRHAGHALVFLKFNKSDMLTYAGLLQLKYKAPELYTVCNMAGCRKETKLTTTLGDKVKVNFGNTLIHILACPKFKLLSWRARVCCQTRRWWRFWARWRAAALAPTGST